MGQMTTSFKRQIPVVLMCSETVPLLCISLPQHRNERERHRLHTFVPHCTVTAVQHHETTHYVGRRLPHDDANDLLCRLLNLAYETQTDNAQIKFTKPSCCRERACHCCCGCAELRDSTSRNRSRQSGGRQTDGLIPQSRVGPCHAVVTFILGYILFLGLKCASFVLDLIFCFVVLYASKFNKSTSDKLVLNEDECRETGQENETKNTPRTFPKINARWLTEPYRRHVGGNEISRARDGPRPTTNDGFVHHVTLLEKPARKQETEDCHGNSTCPDCNFDDSESEENIPALSDDEHDNQPKLKTLELDEKIKSHNHGSIVSADFLRQSLQLLIKTTDEHESGQSGQKPHKKPNSDEGLDETDDEESSFEDFYQASTMRFTPDGRNLIVSCLVRDMTAELARYGSFDVSRSESAQQWLSRLQDAGGLWVLRLAQAGFYRPDENGTTLRCAFCKVEVPGDQMIGRQPMDVHKELSPNCPLITGGDTTNRSMGQFWQTGGQEYVQRFHEDPERQVVHCKPSEQPEHPKDGPGVGLPLQPERTESPSITPASPTQNNEGQSNLSHPAANTPQLPGPVMLEPQSLPTAVNTDGHQSWAPSLQQIPEPVSVPAQSSSPPQQQATPHTFASQTARPEPITWSTTYQIPQPEPQAQTTESTAASDGQEVPAAQEHDQSTAAQGPQSSQPTPSESTPSENPPPSSDPPRQVVTYAQLGIFTQQPKRQDMVVGATRCNTFSGWPHAETHTPDEMSDAGFYYTGHGDLVRCFYCKGGLKSWAEHLRPWVEHARFFPECPYVSQVKGHLYVEVVKELHEKQERVSEEEVERELEKRCRAPNQQKKEEKAEESGASWMEEGGAVGGAVGKTNSLLDDKNSEEDLGRRMEELENEIQDAKEERICKICQSNEVSILFLPCGHLVSCAQCAPALRTCAICRQRVKGRVRVYMDEEEG